MNYERGIRAAAAAAAVAVLRINPHRRMRAY